MPPLTALFGLPWYQFSLVVGWGIVRLIHDERTSKIKLYSGNHVYVINDSVCIYLKHSSKRLSPWNFTFLPEHIKEIQNIRRKINNLYTVLICNDDGICCLNFSEFSQLIYIGDFGKSKSIRISRSRREKYSISGSDGKLRHKIGDSDFPRKIFV